MSDDLDDDLRLRDKLAAAVVPGLIERFNSKVSNQWIENGEPTEVFRNNAKLIARMAYILADEMRKARLQAFT